jgi:DNA-binding transcriptional ArsR family regulator
VGSTKAKFIEENGYQIRVVHMEQVEQARRKSITDNELERLSMTFRILGDPNRLKIVLALRDAEMCVCDLAAFTGSSESAVSHQLRRLKDLNLVRKRRAGQIIYYSLDDECVRELLNVGIGHVRE